MPLEALMTRGIFTYSEFVSSVTKEPDSWSAAVAPRARLIHGVLGGEHTLAQFPPVDIAVPELGAEADGPLGDLRSIHREALGHILRICRGV